MVKKNIVVTGGSGMTGRSLKKFLPNATYLSSSDYDLRLESDVIKMYEQLKPDCVIHLAALVGGIVDNINRPYNYFTDNVLMNTLLVKYARIYGVDRFMAILSTCVYPDKLDEDLYPLKEGYLHMGPPPPTNFSYGYAKRSLAVQIDASNAQFGTKYQYLIPCNLYGEYFFDKWGLKSHFVSALIKKIIIAHDNGSDHVELFGTGKPLRQFMYVDDFAWVIKSVIDSDITDNFNVATSNNISISEIADIALKVFKTIKPETKIKGFKYDDKQPDGQYRKDVSIDKLKQLLPEFKETPLSVGLERIFRNVFYTFINKKDK